MAHVFSEEKFGTDQSGFNNDIVTYRTSFTENAPNSNQRALKMNDTYSFAYIQNGPESSFSFSGVGSVSLWYKIESDAKVLPGADMTLASYINPSSKF